MKDFKVEMQTFGENGAVAITSILKGPEGIIFVGLTSKDHPLLGYDTRNGKFFDTGLMFRQRANNISLEDKIHNSLVMDKNGLIFVGQGLNIDWNTAPHAFNLRKYGGGHMFSYDPQSGKTEDYGVVVPLNAVHGMTYDAKYHRIYGYTIPDNHFFRFDIDTGKTTDYGKISPYACHNYVAAKNGDIYGAWHKTGPYNSFEDKNPSKGTYLLKYDAAKDELIRTESMIIYGPEYDIFYNIGIDSWLCTRSGEIYGGTVTGGVLFKVDTQNDTISNLGKPVHGPRLTSLAEATDGTIYGCAGFPHMSLFSFDPKIGCFKDFGKMSDKGDFWYLHCITIGDDGVIYGGETDAGKACLVRLIPQNN